MAQHCNHQSCSLEAAAMKPWPLHGSTHSDGPGGAHSSPQHNSVKALLDNWGWHAAFKALGRTPQLNKNNDDSEKTILLPF